MKAYQSFQQCLSFLLFFTTLVMAWPWPRFLPEIDAVIVRRASIGDGQGVAASTAASSNGASNTPQSAAASVTGSTTPTATGSSPSSGNSNSNSSATTTADINPADPAGGISMLTPAATATSYYKIGSPMTLVWNYTSLQVTPTAIDIVASVSGNPNLYTISTDVPVSNSTQAITWDTGAYQSGHPGQPLVQDTYTLIVYDAGGPITAAAQAGYLAPNSQYKFAMYTPQPYSDSPASGYQCAVCSGALSGTERQALGLMGIMGGVAVLSSMWFLNGVNVRW